MKPLLVALALFCLHSSAAAQPARAERSNVANGERVYLRVGCQACHGTVGHGGAARRLTPNPLPLSAFTAWVRNGSAGWTFLSGMPAFSPSVIADDELADVRAYLASLPPPPPVSDIPLLAP